MLFNEGKITSFGREGRTTLMESLVASGALSAKQLERARAKRRGSRRTLGEVLVESGGIAGEALVEAARSRLLDDVCELVCTEAGEFAFHRGSPPRDVFDPEERALELELPAGPLLLEAARRSDHWAITRTWIPSDTAHFVVQRRPDLPEAESQRALAERLLERLDGTRSVAEVVCAFPHHRFEAHELLAGWLKGRRLRVAGVEELLRIATRLAPVDAERARVIVQRGLEEHPRHPELLAELARLAEELDDGAAAVDALKLLVHGRLESAERDGAREALAHALELAPQDTFLWQQSLAFALQDGSADDAIAAGKRLAELYREPGLFRRAAAVYAELVELAPDSWELRRELAHAQVDSGEVKEGIKGLERFGRKLISDEDYAGAREVYRDVLELVPGHADAKEMIRMLDAQVFAERRARRRRWTRLAISGAILALLGWCFALEISARAAFSNAQRSVSELGLIEDGRYAEAIAAFEEVRRRHPWTPTSLFDVRSRLTDLRAREQEAAREPAAATPAPRRVTGVIGMTPGAGTPRADP